MIHVEPADSAVKNRFQVAHPSDAELVANAPLVAAEIAACLEVQP
jgi:hypothetical protein